MNVRWSPVSRRIAAVVLVLAATAAMVAAQSVSPAQSVVAGLGNGAGRQVGADLLGAGSAEPAVGTGLSISPETRARDLLRWPAADVPGQSNNRGPVDVMTIHRYLGYATFAGVVTTGLLGLFAPQSVHGPVAIGTAMMSATNSALGVIGHGLGGALRDPHILFSMVGSAGFFTNVFLTEPGSLAHRITGGVAVASYSVAVSWKVFR